MDKIVLQKEKGTRRVFTPYIRRNGKIYYPRNRRFFSFLVND